MKKFLAVVKHEYKKVVLKWSFLIGTLLLPFLAACFAVVPALIFSLKGEPTRIVIADPTGKIAPRLKANLSAERMDTRARRAAEKSFEDLTPSQETQMRRSAEQFTANFEFIDYETGGALINSVRSDLNAMLVGGSADAYLIIPEDINSEQASFEFRSRKAGDFVDGAFKEALNDAVRSQRLADANISEDELAELSRNVNLDAKGIDERG